VTPDKSGTSPLTSRTATTGAGPDRADHRSGGRQLQRGKGPAAPSPSANIGKGSADNDYTLSTSCHRDAVQWRTIVNNLGQRLHFAPHTSWIHIPDYTFNAKGYFTCAPRSIRQTSCRSNESNNETCGRFYVIGLRRTSRTSRPYSSRHILYRKQYLLPVHLPATDPDNDSMRYCFRIRPPTARGSTSRIRIPRARVDHRNGHLHSDLRERSHRLGQLLCGRPFDRQRRSAVALVG